MNLNSFIGYCAGIPYVMKDKLDNALADERLLQNQNMDEAEVTQRQTLRQNAEQGAMINRFSQSAQTARSLPMPPPTPQMSDVLARMLNNAAAQQREAAQGQGLLAQLRAQLSNPAALARTLTAGLMAQVANLFFGGKRLEEADQAAKERRKKADEKAAEEDPSLLLVDVTAAFGLGTSGGK